MGRNLYFFVGACAAVVLLCGRPAYPLAESTAGDGSNAQAAHGLGYTGSGINVAVLSQNNARADHEAFNDAQGAHVTNLDYGGAGVSVSNHDTWVAGVTASRGGAAHSQARGAAPDAKILSARLADNSSGVSFASVAAALADLAANHDCRIVVTGIAFPPSNITPDGQSQWTMLYDYYAYEHNIFFANPAGNSGSDISVFGDAYNGLTVGGLNVTEPDVYRRVGSTTGSGPTADGRRKPELTAPVQNQTIPSGGSSTAWTTWTSGGGETSFAAPHAAGAAAVLLELADSAEADAFAGRHEVVKACLVNAAFPNIRNKGGAATVGEVYDHDRGYGRIDVARALQTLQGGSITPGPLHDQARGWAYAPLSAQQQVVYHVYAPRGARLVATLTWSRRIEWQDRRNRGVIDSGELSAHFADLDLIVRAPTTATVLFSQDLLGLNPADNLEKCDILAEVSGYYELIVVNKSTQEDAAFALAFEVLEPLPGDLNADYRVDMLDFVLLADNWLQQGPEPLVGDINGDQSVNLPDFALMAGAWLQFDPRYYGD